MECTREAKGSSIFSVSYRDGYTLDAKKVSLHTLTTSYLLNALLTLLGLRREADISLTLLFFLSLALLTKEWRGGPALFVSGSLVGFVMEYLGLAYGIPFGSYEYLKFKGATVLGVPIPIIISWGVYLYTSYIAASNFQAKRYMVTPLLMVILDMAIDPVMVDLGVWRWEIHGPWFGIPIENFIGWFFTSCLALLLYRFAAGGHDLQPLGIAGMLPYLSSFLPIIAVSSSRSLPAALISFLLASLTTLIVTMYGIRSGKIKAKLS